MMSANPRTSVKQAILKVSGTLLTLIFLVYLLNQQGWDEIIGALRQVSSATLISVAGLLIMSRLLVAGRWYFLVSAVAPEISFLQSLRMTLAGLFSANFLPTTVGGDIIRLAAVLKRAQDRGGAATSIAADRLVGLVGMAAALPLGIAQFVSWLSTHEVETSGVLLGVVCGLIISSTLNLKDSFATFMSTLRKTFKALFDWFKRPKSLVLAFICTWSHMVCLFSMIRLLLADMGSSVSFWSIAGLWSFTYFITLMPFSINGLGLREVSIGFIFPELGGVSTNAALTMAIILRAIDIFVSLSGAFFITRILTEIRQPPVGNSEAELVREDPHL